jgi:hypothetical protein
MRAPSALLALALLALGPAACGGSGAARPATSAAHAKRDRDLDNDNNDDDQLVLGFGHVASAGEARPIVALVKRYYAAAAAEDGRAACRMLAPFVAESVAENQGQSPRLRGGTCPVVMSKVFAVQHRELAAKSADYRFVRIGVEGDHALVALEFPAISEVHQLTLRRIGGRWWVLHLIDDHIE